MKTSHDSSIKLPALLVSAANLLVLSSAMAQPPGAGASDPPPSAREAAPFDMTGYWVSVVTEDWRWRMLTPPVGDAGSIPLNQAGTEAAANWTPDSASAPVCQTFGGAGIIRQPGRLHVSWEDEETLRIDFSAGNQTRLLHFGTRVPPDNIEPSLQGYTTARWYKERQTRGLGFGGPPADFQGGNLRATTTHLEAAYLQSNGVPYSEQTSMETYYKVIDGPAGNKWLIVTSVVSDPVYLRQDWITSTHFKQEASNENWNPTDCR